LKLLVINAQIQVVHTNSLFFILFTKKIITRDNYIENNINYFFNNLPYRANGYEMIFTHTLTHLLNEIMFLLLSISNKLTEKIFYPYPSYRIRYESGKWVKGYHWHGSSALILLYFNDHLSSDKWKQGQGSISFPNSKAFEAPLLCWAY
jgi:hypothetical protein